MRTCIGGDGTDTTAAVVAYLTAGHQFKFANLFLIGDLNDPTSVLLTDWESPLLWNPVGTFLPAAIERSKVESRIGLKVIQLAVNWKPVVTQFTLAAATANPYQRAILGIYDNKPVRVWRTIMPSPGDATTFGAYALFGGRISQCEVTRGKIVLTVNSFLDAVNMQIPPNVIETTNTLATYKGNTPVLSDGETVLAQFTVVAPSGTTNINATCTAPTPGKIYGNNKFQFGYVAFNASSTLAGFYNAIAQNADFNAGGGVHYNQIILFAALPWAPSPGDTFYVGTQYPIDQAQGKYFGFPFVPQPESAI